MNQILLSAEAARRLAEDVIDKGRDVREFVSLAVLRERGRERHESEEIRKGLAEADAGDFASDEEVEAVFARYDRDASR